MHEAAFGRPDEARLAARLRQEASPLVSRVAEQAGRVIGHVLFSPVTVEGERERPGVAAGALGPAAVLPDAQGQGAGASLIRAGIEACRALDWRILFVLGDPAYYARFGFGLAARRHSVSDAGSGWRGPRVAARSEGATVGASPKPRLCSGIHSSQLDRSRALGFGPAGHGASARRAPIFHLVSG